MSNNIVEVRLSVFEWHILLKELESIMQIANRETKNAEMIYETISKQLHDGGVKIIEDK